jgi:hypothetical protein
MRAAWASIAVGIFVALLVNSNECGTWGLSCFAHAFMIVTGTMLVSSTLFFRAIELAAPGSPQRKIASLLAGLCMAFAIAGITAIVAVISR